MLSYTTALTANIREFVRAAFLTAAFIVASPASALPTIVVAPGSSPAGGYLALSLFGVPPIAGMGDETIMNFPVPSFDYAGESWTDLGVSSNGYVVVGGGSGPDNSFINQNLPDPTRPNNVLAPFWTDLDPSVGGAVRIEVLTDGSDTWIVVDWAAVREFSQNRFNTFEIWIGINTDANPAEDISFAYGPIGGNGDGGFLTIGAEDKTGTVGGMYYFNGTGGTLPSNGTQLRVTTRDFPEATVPEPATLALLGIGLAGLGLARRKQ